MCARPRQEFADVAPAAPRGRPAGPWAMAENILLALVFIVAVALPLAEIVLRFSLGVGIVGVAAIVQHLMLAVGMLGAAVAAREERLLTLAVAGFLRGRLATVARFASRLVATSVALLLVLTASDFVAVERQAGTTLAYGVPVWLAELPLPLGFGLIAGRLVWQAAPSLRGRALAVALVTALVGGLLLGLWSGALDPAPLATPAVLTVLLATLLGAPIFVAIGGAALFLLLASGVPATAVAVDHYSLVMNPSLPAIPMFTLAGYLLAESQAPQRLIEVFDALFGRLRGGPAIAVVLACTFFTSFTGASGVTVLALGGLVMPLLRSHGYAQRSALGLVTAAGLPGTLLMPALPLILYAIVAGVAIEDMFLGGLLPALMMAAVVAAWGLSRQPAGGPRPAPFDRRRVLRALAAAKWELSLPLVPLAALASGLATPVESAALTALYALVVTVFIQRDLHLTREVPRVISECGLIVGGILLIMGLALGLTDFLVDARIPDRLVDWVTQATSNRHLFLLALNACLLAAGCLIEIYPAIMVLAPIVSHLGQAFGIHPVHLGIIFLANMELGYLTPLVGLNLLFAAFRFGQPVAELFRSVLPVFVALAVGVLIITYVPWLSTALLGLRN